MSLFQTLHHRSKNDIAFGNRTWDEYKTGFGNAGSDYWVGLKHMHAMTDSSPKFLVVRLFFRTKASTEPISTSAAYHSFAVKDESMSYQLQISGYDEQNSEIGGCLYTTACVGAVRGFILTNGYATVACRGVVKR